MSKVHGFLLLGLVLFMGCSSPKAATGATHTAVNTQKKRICPDQWVINKQPKIVRKEADDQATVAQADEYFMYKGKRLEKEQMDTDWVRRNCRLEPTFVN